MKYYTNKSKTFVAFENNEEEIIQCWGDKKNEKLQQIPLSEFRDICCSLNCLTRSIDVIEYLDEQLTSRYC